MRVAGKTQTDRTKICSRRSKTWNVGGNFHFKWKIPHEVHLSKVNIMLLLELNGKGGISKWFTLFVKFHKGEQNWTDGDTWTTLNLYERRRGMSPHRNDVIQNLSGKIKTFFRAQLFSRLSPSQRRVSRPPHYWGNLCRKLIYWVNVYGQPIVSL